MTQNKIFSQARFRRVTRAQNGDGPGLRMSAGVRGAISASLAIALIVSVCAALSTRASANGKERLTLELLLDWESVASPQISPDGSQIVYTRRWTDKINDRFESDVWIMSSDGSKNRFLLKGSSPKWSPDGKRLLYSAPGQPTGSQL